MSVRKSSRKRSKSEKAELNDESESRYVGQRGRKGDLASESQVSAGEYGEEEDETPLRQMTRKRKKVEKFDPSAGLNVMMSPRVRVTAVREGGCSPTAMGDIGVREETPRAKETPRAQETPRAKETSRAKETPRAQETSRAKETSRVKETHRAKETPRANGKKGNESLIETGVGSLSLEAARVTEEAMREEEYLTEEGEVPSEGCWQHCKDLCEMLPGRKTQIELLLALFGEPNSAVFPSLHVYGHTGTGKTLVLQTILRTLQVPHAYVNCVECYTSRILYEVILNQLSGSVLSDDNGYSGYARCGDMAAFVRLLQKVTDSQGYNSQTTYIVLDRAERLRDLEVTLLPAMLRLAELSGCSVCVILVSELTWNKFHMDCGSLVPLPLHFPDYSKVETLEIMSRDCPPSHPRPFYQTFNLHIWNVFHSVCRDLSELRHLSALLFPKYCEPVEANEIGSHEVRKLWKHIEPYFKSVMSKLYLRELSSSQWERVQSSTQNCDLKHVAEGVSAAQSPLELPYYSKYLLIATYLASYNPAITDKRFFAKQRQSRTRRTRKVPKKEKPNYQLLGPKAFPLDRLMAIFYSILEEELTHTADVYCQITSLVTLQLISQANSRDAIESPKYKCLVTLDFIRQVARSVGFDIILYLYDFA